MYLALSVVSFAVEGRCTKTDFNSHCLALRRLLPVGYDGDL